MGYVLSVLKFLNEILETSKVASRDERDLKRDLFEVRHTVNLSWTNEGPQMKLKRLIGKR